MNNDEKGRELFFRAKEAREQGHHAEAEQYLREALRYAPGRESLRTNLCGALIDQGKHAEALPMCEELVRDFPGSAVAWHRLSLCQFEDMQTDAALESIERCLDLNPDFVEALNHKVAILLRQDDTDAALAAIEQAIALAPHDPFARTGLGVVHTARREFAKARDAHRQALAMDPDDPDKQWNLSLAQLMLGELREGWQHMEGRWYGSRPVDSHYDGDTPTWDGKTRIAGHKLLVWAEQGLGDTLQFCRFLPALLERGAEVILQVPATLLPLVQSLQLPANARFSVSKEGNRPSAHDFNIPLMSLPGCLGVDTLAALPAPARLTPPADRSELWRKHLGERSRPRVGLMWKGNLINLRGLARSMEIAELAEVLALPLEFHCVSDSFSPEDQAWLVQQRLPVHSHAADIRDFADTASLIAQLDLLVTIDTSIAHLGPSLGIPTWVLLPWTADWRWGMEGPQTAWYPQSRLFRQQRLGEWQAPVQALVAALRTHFSIG